MVKSELLRAGFETVQLNPVVAVDYWPDIVVSCRQQKVIMVASVMITGHLEDLEMANKSLTDKLQTEQILSWAALNHPRMEVLTVGIVLNDRGAWAQRSHKDLVAAGILRTDLDLISMEIVRRATVLWDHWRTTSTHLLFSDSD